MVLFYYVVRTVNKMDQMLKDQDYFLLGLVFFVCNYMTICFETLGYHFKNQDLFVLLGIYLIVLFIVLIVYLFKSIYRHSVIETKQQIELDILHNQQSANIKILEAQNDLYQLRHDMKHLFQALHNPEILNDKNNFENTIVEYENLIKSTAVPITTISVPINFVLNIKRDEAISKGIDFTSALNITHEIAMEDSDLYLLLSNLLDNAIEHIGILKKIRVEMNDVEKMFKIKITNSIDHPVLDNRGNFISASSDPEHGYGIITIDKILNKYDGFVSYTEVNNDLVATVMLHNN